MALLVTVRKDWKKDLLKWLLYSALFILANLILPQLSIGYPVLKLLSLATNFAAVVLLAPLAEEVFFRFFLINALHKWGFTVPVIVLVTAGLFSLFHYQAYGASLSAQNASFVGAFIFGLVAAFVAIRQRSLIPTIIMHFTINLWLFIRYIFRTGG